MKRWLAQIRYGTEAGTKLVERAVEELSEVHRIVEQGPHWNTIQSIRIVKPRGQHKGLTLEQAEKLRCMTAREITVSGGYTLENLD